MALTCTVRKRNVVGAAREAVVDVTFDSSYPTGGEAFVTKDVDPSQAASQAFDFVTVSSTTVPAANDFYYDYTNKKLMAFVRATGVEVADTTNLATNICRVLVRYQQVSG